MHGKHGELTDVFTAAKGAPSFRDLFCGGLRLGWVSTGWMEGVEDDGEGTTRAMGRDGRQ